jgi:hypothetical protein
MMKIKIEIIWNTSTYECGLVETWEISQIL